MQEKIIHKELSYRVNRCIFDVHNEVGPELREECYQKAMQHRLAQSKIPFLAKPKTRSEFVYRDTSVNIFEPDLLIADRIILELKHQPQGFARDNYVQVLNYLKFWDLRLGLLVNYAMDKAVIERIPYAPREGEIEENYDYIRDLICDEQSVVLRGIRESLLGINQQVGIGYAATVYRNLAIVEFRWRGLKCEPGIEVAPSFREWKLPTSRISPVIVEGGICVQIDAIYDQITARAVRTMQTHLRATGCHVGLIACFGKTKFMIRAVRR